MSEHIRFKAVIREAKSFIALAEDNLERVNDNLERVWEDWSSYCVYCDNKLEMACTHEENTEPNKMCAFKSCPYINNKS